MPLLWLFSLLLVLLHTNPSFHRPKLIINSCFPKLFVEKPPVLSKNPGFWRKFYARLPTEKNRGFRGSKGGVLHLFQKTSIFGVFGVLIILYLRIPVLKIKSLFSVILFRSHPKFVPLQAGAPWASLY